MQIRRTTSRNPVVIRWLWNECPLVGGDRAFIVEVPIELRALLVGAPSRDGVNASSESDVNEYLERVASQASRWPGTVTRAHISCVVDSEGRVLDAYVNPWFGYASLWNGYSPLRRMGVRLANLTDIQSIPAEVLQKALDDDIASTWCLDREAWDGTELAIDSGHLPDGPPQSNPGMPAE